MIDRGDSWRSTASRGCLATGVGAAALTVLAPFVLAFRAWRRWRRGSDIRTTIGAKPLTNSVGAALRRVDLCLDVPPRAEPGFRRRLTEAVIRVAEALRMPDDVYHLVYRIPSDKEPFLMPVGPQLQELGERFSLVHSEGAMAGRTVLWLTLGRDRALSEVVDPDVYDPEADGEPERLLTHPDLRWSMATEWARVGPSLVIRLILVVPSDEENRVKSLLASLT